MFIEIYLIKSFVLLFGDPVISLAVVLSGVLIYSGAGGFWASKIDHKRIGNMLLVLLAVLAASARAAAARESPVEAAALLASKLTPAVSCVWK